VPFALTDRTHTQLPFSGAGGAYRLDTSDGFDTPEEAALAEWSRYPAELANVLRAEPNVARRVPGPGTTRRCCGRSALGRPGPGQTRCDSHGWRGEGFPSPLEVT